MARILAHFVDTTLIELLLYESYKCDTSFRPENRTPWMPRGVSELLHAN